jgi:hypothetical protein
VTNRQKIAAVATAILGGGIDPFAGCRRIVELVGNAERDDADILTIRGIESETDHLPLPEHRALWDPTVLAEKDIKIQAYLKLVGPVLREACFRLAAKWRAS